MQRLTSSCSGLASLGQAAVTRALPQLLNLHTLPVFPESAVCVTHTTYANCNTGDLSPRETEARIWPPHSRLTHSQAAGRNKRAQGQGRRGLGTKGSTLAPPTYGDALRSRPDRTLHASLPKEQLSLKATILFEAGWRRVEEKWGDTYVCPREVVWLNGAPGSGKGTNMPFIVKSRGLSRSVGMSQLLDGDPEIKSFIDRGELVPDALVLDALLNAVLNPEINDGAGLVIDGFPRTALQVDFVKLLHDRLLALSGRHADTAEAWRFPRPSFKVVILYVDEAESMRRQMRRAQIADLHNKRVADAGTGEVWDVRTTDINEQLCRRRYQVFKMHYQTILRLKQFFPFSLIDAMGTPEECRQQIMRELRYQSSLDLDAATYGAIRHLPLARDLVRVARQRLVFRLDSYAKRAAETFGAVISLIEAELIPLLKTCSLAGHAVYRSRSPVLLGDARAVDMMIDILSDRGFSVAHSEEERVVPLRVNLGSGEIESRAEIVHVFRITFDKENVRDLSTPVSVTTAEGEEVAIGTTFIPSHMQRESLARQLEATHVEPAPAAAPGPACHIDPALSCLDPVLGQDLCRAKCSVSAAATDDAAVAGVDPAIVDAATSAHQGQAARRGAEPRAEAYSVPPCENHARAVERSLRGESG
ncbi:hypothetical protein ACKKBG_A31795 [Auxenochlorella protothecoides x Auxenochlorella symbiontica]